MAKSGFARLRVANPCDVAFREARSASLLATVHRGFPRRNSSKVAKDERISVKEHFSYYLLPLAGWL